MEQRLFLCADLGTSSLKAALIDNSGRLFGFARVHYAGSDIWLDAFYRAVEQLALSLPPLSAGLTPVSAVCISGSGPTLVPVCGDNPDTVESLMPVYWYDPVPEIADAPPINKNITSLFLPKLQNYLLNNVEKINTIKYFFSSQEWLSWKLGARPVTVIPHNGYIPYYWDGDQCGALNINKEWFPIFVTMGEVIGTLNAALNKDSPASKLLAPGVPIVAGAADFIMALIGTGTLKPGMVCDRTGSSEGINLCVESDPGSRQGKLRILPHAVAGLWNTGAIIPKSGTLFDEYRAAIGQEEKPHNELTKEIFGTKNHPGMAVLETMAGNFINALDTIEQLGFAIKELTLSGGQCGDPLWNQYKADVSGRVLNVPEIIHAELAGGAILCEAAISGKSLQETAAKMVRIKEIYTPA